jgi:hypothetical protein
MAYRIGFLLRHGAISVKGVIRRADRIIKRLEKKDGTLNCPKVVYWETLKALLERDA